MQNTARSSMARRRRRSWQKKRHTSAEKSNRPVAGLSKLTYALALISLAVCAVGVGVAVTSDGSIIKIFAGGGFCFLLVGLMLFTRAIKEVKNDREPLQARVLSVIASAMMILPWGYLYIMGIIHD